MPNAYVLLFVLKARVRSIVGRGVTWAKEILTEAFHPLPIITGLVGDLVRSREDLVAENMMLRQQLIVASRKVKKPCFRPLERGLMVLLSRIVACWRDAVLLVNPDTIVRWHREGFRVLWKRKSKSGTARRSPLAKVTIDLIERLSRENRLWGAVRRAIRAPRTATFLPSLPRRISKKTAGKRLSLVRGELRLAPHR